MEKLRKRINIRIIFLVFFCIIGMFLCLLKKLEFDRVGSVHYNSVWISPQSINQAMNNKKQQSTEQENEIEYLLWNQKEGKIIKSLSTGKTKTLSKIECYGETSLFLPMNLVSGFVLQRNDELGCLIDKKTAFDLFGTVQAVDNLVYLEEKNFIVRGVLDTPEEFIMVIDGDIQKMYCNTELLFKKKETSSSMVQRINNFLSFVSLPSESLVMDNGIFITIECFLYLIPSILFYFILIIKWFSHSPFSCIALCIIGLAVFLHMFLIPVVIPDDLIPNQWSDFDFYQMKYKEIIDNLIRMNHSIPTYKGIYLRNRVGISIVYVVMGIIFHVFCVPRVYNPRNIKRIIE